MNASADFLRAISALTELRTAVEKEMASVDWTSNSHADTEAPGFIQLAIAEVAATEVLAKSNRRFVVPGTAAARAAYEVVITCAWMLETLDLAERDRRWMALFREEAKYWRRMVTEAEDRVDPKHIIDAMRAEVARVEAIINEVKPQSQRSA